MDVVSVQDANKIRVAMGLAPLPVPGEDAGLAFKGNQDDASDSDENDKISTLDKRQAAAGDNWLKMEEERKAKLDRLARKEAMKKQRDAAQMNARLEGKTLGDAEEGDMDTKTWLRQQKKRQAAIEKARKYEEEQALREQQQQEYTSKDLAGLKVGHELDRFGEAGEQILTLKDAMIGGDDESEGDELENADMLEKEKLAEQLELKKKKPVYDPNDIDESGERSILKHYDDEGASRKRKRFVLDSQGGGSKAAAVDDEEGIARSRGIKISLDLLKDDIPISDYAEASAAKIKKPKKPKKAKVTRQKEVDADDIFPVPSAAEVPQQNGQDSMQIDGEANNETGTTTRQKEIEFDDDDLQRQLAEQRRLKLKKMKRTDAAELARRIREEASATPADMNDEDGEEPGMTIDETTEFIANLQRPTAPEERRARRDTSEPAPAHDEDGDAAMADLLNERDAPAFEHEDSDAHEAATAADPMTASGFEMEEQIDQGIGASLSMLRKRGLITDGFAVDQAEKDRARQKFMYENRALIADYDAQSRVARERDRTSGKFERMSARERENYARHQNEQREAYLASLQAQHFAKNYKPDVKLEYHDEYGRSMNQKEAFKHMSHQFHGKGSGKGKTEKRLKKIEDEKRREAQGGLEGKGGYGRNLGEQARKKGTAGVRLQ